MAQSLHKGTETAPAEGTALRLSELTFAWPRDAFTLAVDHLEVRRGERLLIKGPSGCGKSTLLGLMCGILHPQSGSIQVAGSEIAGLRGAASDRFRADHFGIIFQMFNLLPYGTTLDNVLLPLSFSQVRRRRAETGGAVAEEARRLLRRLGLADELSNRPATTLSVGQQQRVAVARALIGQPDLIIADEPTSALDRDRQEAFLHLLNEEVARAGATLIMVSHDETLAPRFARSLDLSEVARTGP